MSTVDRVIFCDADSLADFRQVLRSQPDIAEFVAELYKVGLIEGLRGITIAPAGKLPPSGGVVPVLPQEAETRLLEAAMSKGA